MTALVIIDMQPGFASAKKCVNQVVDLVKMAKSTSSTIVLVELNPHAFNKTLHPIIKAVSGYRKLLKIIKNEDNGSSYIQKVLNNTYIGRKTNIDKIRVCGVYSNCCVQATALGLADIYQRSKIIIHPEACCGSSGEQQSLEHIEWNWLKSSPKNLYFTTNGKLVSWRKNVH